MISSMRAAHTDQPLRRLASNRGFNLLELVVTMGIATTLFAAALPHFNNRREDANSFTKNLLADLRSARAKAIVGGAHYTFLRNGSSYQIERLTKIAGQWQFERVVKRVDAPLGVSWWMSPAALQFNTRGMQVATGNESVSIEMWDDLGAQRVISVWPSGQSYEEQ